jgi:hypothetical protein
MSIRQANEIESKNSSWNDIPDEDKEVLAIRTLFRALNRSGRVNSFEEVLIHVLNIEHRTLQQNFWRMIANVAAKYYEHSQPNYFDARNEDSIEFTKAISELNAKFSHI